MSHRSVPRERYPQPNLGGCDRRHLTHEHRDRSLPPALQPAALFTPTPKAARRVLEFFTAQINNDHTRKAYLNATRRFATWCEGRGIRELAGSSPTTSPPSSRS